MHQKTLICGILLLGSLSSTAYGYIDPGVGNMLVQAMLAGSAGVLFVIRMFWGRIMSHFRPPHFDEKQKDHP